MLVIVTCIGYLEGKGSNLLVQNPSEIAHHGPAGDVGGVKPLALEEEVTDPHFIFDLYLAYDPHHAVKHPLDLDLVLGAPEVQLRRPLH